MTEATKILKVKIGEMYDAEKKKSFPVYKTFWLQKDGSYLSVEKVFVQEVGLKNQEQKQEIVSADIYQKNMGSGRWKK